MKEKVSVIIPTYKRSKYILRAINSVLSQKNIEIECIVVDDNGIGSEEQKNVECKLKEYILENRIKYIKHDSNRGGSSARNTGIKNSIGNYISFLDDDDWYDKKKIFEQIKFMKKLNCSVNLCGFRRYYKNSIENSKKYEIDNSFKRKLLAFEIDSCAGSCLILKKEILKNIGLFNENFKRHQDLEFLFRISKEYKICYLDKVLVNIFMHRDNLSKKSGLEIEKNRLFFIDNFKADIEKFPLKDIKYILMNHYIEISKSYLKNLNIILALKWIFKTESVFVSLKKVIKDSIKYFIKRRKAN